MNWLKFFLYLFKKIILNFVIFVATKKVGQQVCFPPPLLLLMSDPGAGMDKNHDPGAGINPGSGTLPKTCVKTHLGIFWDQVCRMAR